MKKAFIVAVAARCARRLVLLPRRVPQPAAAARPRLAVKEAVDAGAAGSGRRWRWLSRRRRRLPWGGGRGPLTVELAKVYRAPSAQRDHGRRQPHWRRDGLGRPAHRGTPAGALCPARRSRESWSALAKIEDFEIVEQVKQAEAAQEVSARDHSPARSRPAARRDQRRTVA